MIEFHTIIDGIDLLPVIRLLRERLYSDHPKAMPAGFASEYIIIEKLSSLLPIWNIREGGFIQISRLFI